MMTTLKNIAIFLFLSICLSSSWANNAHDDFLECLSHKIMNSNSKSKSQVIYTPKNSSYSTIYNSFSDNLRITSHFKPSIIFTPNEESQIQVAIYCSKKHGLQIRIRGGGHDYEGLSYISETPFVIIDLRNLRSISINTQKKTAWIQAGATLGEVYYRIAEKSKKLAFVAGVCPTVGVGGHFSGGGYGMMSRKFGIAADNIIDAKLIDVNGQIQDRESMGEDLFWAIRGGGGTSFGLIISWKVKLLDIPEKVTVFNVTRTLEQNATQLVYKWQHIADKVDDNLLLRLFLKSSESPFRRGKRTVHAFFTTMFVGGVDELLHEMQKRFPELGLVKEDCIEMSWIESTLFFAGFPRGTSLDVLLHRNNSATNPEYYFKGKSDYVQRPISINGLEGIWKLLNQLESENSGAELQFSPYGGKLSDISEFETPFPHRDGNIFMIHYSVFWWVMEDSNRNIAWIRNLYEYMAKYVSKSPRASYFNYRDLDLGVNNKGNTSYAQARIWGERYFKNNFDRLVKVKTKIDPTNFFRNEQSIPPLLS
ncbi:tetrahydroberberine oxidase-like [Solanum dulcamara]|uniref:tetrahydroberberine oxidase-like n=1 Tax=Solanum dulcamara TaxID=45834 RepID=UPI002485AD5F|nr:tetrahydroberberine oxidase-like [Solanum dulcamara]